MAKQRRAVRPTAAAVRTGRGRRAVSAGWVLEDSWGSGSSFRPAHRDQNGVGLIVQVLPFHVSAKGISDENWPLK
jgi:hypothetical protein